MSAIIVLRRETPLVTVARAAEAQGLTRVGEVERAHRDFARTVWRAASGAVVLYRQDHVLEQWVVEVNGDGADAVASALRPSLPEWPAAERHADLTSDDPVVALTALRAQAWAEVEAPGRQTLAAVERLLAHPAEAVRRASMRVCLITGWRAVVPLLRARAAHDKALADDLVAFADHLDRA